MSDHRKVRSAGEGRKRCRCDSAAMLPSPTHFFRIMLPVIIQEKKLRIPKRFIRRFGVELSANAKLAVPNGSDWSVKLDKIDKELYFTDGWHQFAQHHSIKEFYFLVFKYRGNSSFNVVIFDLSTTEVCYDKKSFPGKQYPSHHEEELEEIDDDDDKSIEILGPSPSPCLEPKLGNRKLTLGGSSNPPAQKNSDEEDEQPVQNGKGGKPFGTKSVSRGSSTKKPEMTQIGEEAITAARKFVAEDFSRKLPMRFTEFIKLWVSDGREWCVRYICSKDKRKKISMGWSAFVLANDLKEGDVCVFEVMQGAEIMLKVTIFRANENGGS